jgi:hypothetical protein
MTRRDTPIFDALAKRYSGWTGEWSVGAYMRGFTYGLRLQEVARPIRQHMLGEPWHVPRPSPWDALDVTPSEHDPSL